MAITWLPEYSVGVKEINDQHKKLIAMIARLHEAISVNHTKKILKEVISGLIDYSKYHFTTEEKYFDQFKYEKTEEHKIEHQAFIERINEIQSNLNTNEITLSFELIDYLEDWLIEHIMGSDQMYSELFMENGLS